MNPPWLRREWLREDVRRPPAGIPAGKCLMFYSTRLKGRKEFEKISFDKGLNFGLGMNLEAARVKIEACQ